MSGKYEGVLSSSDPLYRLLANDVLDRILGFEGLQPIFDVYSMDVSATVFRYFDRRSFVNLIGKFYGNKWIHGSQTGEPELRVSLMYKEYDNLRRARTFGLDKYPHCVVRPLAVSRGINCVLVEDFVPGNNLDFYILKAVWGEGSELLERLKDLAWFLADLHNRTQTDRLMNDTRALAYLHKVTEQLFQKQIITQAQYRELVRLRMRWEASQILNTGDQVWIHGDPIPTNIFFNGDHGVTAIDLERFSPGDRAIDLGCVVAELKHLFFWYTNDLWSSEPYIQHFYACYFDYLGDAIEDFRVMTTRGRFNMGCYELRISRNDWLNLDYRRKLVENALECLKI